MNRRSVVVVGVIAVIACARSDIGPVAEPEEMQPEIAPQYWGDFAATLDVPPCPTPSYPPLVVNTTSVAVDGPRDGPTGEGIPLLTEVAEAGAELSILEALWIAANLGGAATITFDADIFPVDQPATIVLDGNDIIPNWGDGTRCIDGRGRGVIIDADQGGLNCGVNCTMYLQTGDLIVGLTLLHLPSEMWIRDGAQVAGCRLNTDGYQTIGDEMGRFWTIAGNGPDAIIGPGNAVNGHFYALRYSGHIFDNFFGYDPLTGAVAQDWWGVMDDPGEVVFEGNVVAVPEGGFARVRNSTVLLLVRNNRFGVDRDGNLFGSPTRGVVHRSISSGGTVQVGPGNIIKGVLGPAIDMSSATTTITRNSITGNEAGIVSMLPPPEITAVTANGVQGTCPVAGTVEVFADPGNQGETFVGDVECASDGGAWALTVAPPSNRNITATLSEAASGITSGFSAPFPVP